MKVVFLVDNQIIRRVDKNILIADSNDYVYAQFIFNSGYNIEDMFDTAHAIFWNGDETEYVDIDDINGQCMIPNSYLGYNSFKISLLLTRDDLTVITTNQVTIDIKPSGFKHVNKPDAYSKITERLDIIDKSIANILFRLSKLEDDQNEVIGSGGSISEPNITTK